MSILNKVKENIQLPIEIKHIVLDSSDAGYNNTLKVDIDLDRFLSEVAKHYSSLTDGETVDEIHLHFKDTVIKAAPLYKKVEEKRFVGWRV